MALVLCAALGCSAGSRDPKTHRVLLVGIDGATLRVAAPLLQEGRLPNLARIASAGVSGPLKSHQPLLSPAVRTTIATGKSPALHGILNWVTLPEPGHESRLYQSTDRKVHALWNIASDAGLAVGVVNWLVTYPVEPIRGVMISDYALPGGVKGKELMQSLFGRTKVDKSQGRQQLAKGPITWPSDWAPRVTEFAKIDAPLTDIANPFAEGPLPKWAARELLSKYFKVDETVVRVALQVEAELHPSLLMVLMQGIDRTSHSLWGTIEPAELYPESLRANSAEREGGARALRRYYEYADALIGKLLERYTEDDLVIVVSDHGFEASALITWLTGGHTSPAAEQGVFFARGPGIQRGADASGVRVVDVTPTILAWWGLPVGADMEGRPGAFLDAGEVTTRPTYDDTPVDRLAAEPSRAADEVMQNLRALGYVQ